MIRTRSGRIAKRTRDLNKQVLKAQQAEADARVKAEAAQTDLAASQEAVENLRDEVKKLKADLSDAAAIHAHQAEDIASFKEEYLQLQLEAADMRGYIARVLEDDTVREVGAVKSDPAVMPEGERRHLQSVLAVDSEARRAPPRSVRKGPAAMMPLQVCGSAVADEASWDNMRYRRPMTSSPPPRKHWTSR